MSAILDRLTISRNYLLLKFKVSLQTSSIGKDNFLLIEADATPNQYGFKSINLAQHYNSISRELYIYFEELPPTGDYHLNISGLKSASGSTLPNESLLFTYDIEGLEPGEDDPEHTPVKIVEIHDKSIRREAFISTEKIKAANPYFYIESTDPESDSMWIDEDHNRGRVAIKFSNRPATPFLHSKYIKAQRKDVTRVGRWETLTTQISIAANSPTVYVYFPSSDATPVYNVDGMVYFEENYKYRVRLSRDIMPQSVL